MFISFWSAEHIALIVSGIFITQNLPCVQDDLIYLSVEPLAELVNLLVIQN